MGAKDEDLPGAKPGQDPLEIEWPDDAAEMRAAERAEKARKAAVTPAPRLLTAAVIGVGIVLAFIGIVAFIGGAVPLFLSVTWPVVTAGVLFALPIGVGLEYVSRGWRKGFPEILFLMSGLAIGAVWTHAGLIVIDSYTTASFSSDEAAFQLFRSIAGVFMATATASAFLAAKFWTDSLRLYPKAVWSLAAAIAVLTVTSVVVFFS